MPKQADSDATRASLLSRARQHDSRAWHELVDLYGPLIAHWCRRSGLDHHAAADCVQQTFTAVLRSLDGYQARSCLGRFAVGYGRLLPTKSETIGGAAGVRRWVQVAVPPYEHFSKCRWTSFRVMRL